MQKLCRNCDKTLERHSKQYCRSCYEMLGTKTKRICTICGNKLSPAASANGALYCRACWRRGLTSRSKTYMNKEWLTEHFRDRKLSIQECATIAQCNIKRIDYWLQRFGLKPITNELRKKLHEEQNHPSIRKTMNRGYIWVYLSRGGKNGDYIKIPEHRWLLQQHLKRELTKSERIHHLNGVKTDNRIENLMLFSNDNEHARFEGKVSFFVKQLLWGNLNSELRDKLFPIFTEFLSRFDQDISA